MTKNNFPVNFRTTKVQKKNDMTKQFENFFLKKFPKVYPHLDCRFVKKDGTSQLRFAVYYNAQTAYIPLGIYLTPNQWDGNKIVRHPNKIKLNNYIALQLNILENLIFSLTTAGELDNLSITQIRDILVGVEQQKESQIIENLLKGGFDIHISRLNNNTTIGIYNATWRLIEKYCNKATTLTYTDITHDWLVSFDKFMSQTMPKKNARNIHLRNLRAVFNTAITEQLTDHYPFRKYKIKAEKTAKRSLTEQQIKTLFTLQPEECFVQYLDIFKLVFYLIGINIIDLYNLKEITSDGRIEYKRAKTSRLYSIKVEPEALAIINKYKGSTHLLNIADRYSNYKDYAHRLNRNLQQMCPCR